MPRGIKEVIKTNPQDKRSDARENLADKRRTE